MIEIRSLFKRYGDHTALVDVDLTVPTGSVYGLVGPNGAGKTTLLSILAGLRHATSGTVTIDVPPTDCAVLPDAPRFDPWLTAGEVVALASDLVGASNAAAEKRALADAGLDEATDRRVGGFSRGMLQRLGIAATLVGAPQLVLLDEPAAALDPAGRHEVLDLIAAARGRATIVFSSHILSDVQAVCDQVGILDKGHVKFEGRVDELLDRAAVGAYRVVLRNDAARISAALRTAPWVETVEENPDGSLRVRVESLSAAEHNLTGALAEAEARVVSLEPESVTLEQVFLELTQ